MGTLEREGKTYVVALLACGWPNHKTYKWSDTKKLMSYGIEDFVYHAFAEVEDEVKIPEKIVVLNGQTQEIGQQAFVEIQTVTAEPEGGTFGAIEGLLLSEEEQIEVSCDVVSVLQAPVQKGDVVGTITYEVAGECYKTEEIIVAEGVPEIDFEWCLKKVAEKYLCMFVENSQ